MSSAVSPRAQSGKCGHVFVLLCDSTGIAADALLVPNANTDQQIRDAGQRDGKTRIFEAAPISLGNAQDTLSATAAVVKTYFHTASTIVVKSVFRRDNPLLALPLYGSGKADVDDTIKDEGAYIETILPLAYDVADAYGVDIALCTTSHTAYSVMQVRRAELCPFNDGPFWMLSESLRAEAARLAAKARGGTLSVFFGAGVSFPSGTPSWGGLLKQLAEEAGFSEQEREALAELDYLDQPTLIEEKMGREALRPAIAAAVSGGQYTPVHAILADLRVPTATTNYDELFERAANGKVARLPWDSSIVSDSPAMARYLTKLHGCVSHPQSIVLTRKDYMRYREGREALRGIIHDLLLTTHIVFVGFSMTDENLHLIIDETRRCLETKAGEDPEGEFGTILSLLDNEMFRHLWDQDFVVTSFGKTWGERPAWMHDCFLDCIGATVAKEKSIASFVLDPHFESLLSSAELKIKNALSELIEISSNDEVRASPAWPNILDLMRNLGAEV